MRGLGVGVGWTVSVGFDCVGAGVGSGPGVVEMGRLLGVEVASVAMVVTGFDGVGGASKIIFSIPQIQIKITISQALVINLCFSIDMDFTACHQ